MDERLLKVNRERLWRRIEIMGHIGADQRGGTSRFSWTEDYKKASIQLIEWMQEIGMETHTDTVGNLFGKLRGKTEKKPVLTGSHLDTVPQGGRFDGIAGILCGLEAIQTMVENGIMPLRPIELAAFINEEATQFLGGCMGSKAICGVLPLNYADICFDKSTGKSLRQAMEEYGMGTDPDRIMDSKKGRDDYFAFLELHIEQGTWLLEHGYPVAIVDTIAGIRQFYITFNGMSAHAGGMPMEKRHDAFMGAAETACMLEKKVIRTGTGARGTVGFVEIVPNEHNIIPSKAVISVDFREADDFVWQDIYDEINLFAKEQCRKRSLTYEITDTLVEPPCHCSRIICDEIEKAAERLGFLCPHMVSYPAHDAMEMGKLYPVGMIFLRSSNKGLSHCPEEYTLPEDLEMGANILLHTLLNLSNI